MAARLYNSHYEEFRRPFLSVAKVGFFLDMSLMGTLRPCRISQLTIISVDRRKQIGPIPINLRKATARRVLPNRGQS